MKLREYEKESKTLKGGKYANKKADPRIRRSPGPNWKPTTGNQLKTFYQKHEKKASHSKSSI